MTLPRVRDVDPALGAPPQQAQELIDADLQALYTWSNKWLVNLL